MSLPVPPFRLLITPGYSYPTNFSSERTRILASIDLAKVTGIELVQIREKSLPTQLLFELVRDAADLTHSTGTQLLVNERFDIALAAGADGVHLTSASMPIEHVREIVPSGFLIGASADSFADVVAARDAGADYAMLGPIFETPGKGDPLGVDGLKRVCTSIAPFPMVGVGGINDSNLGEVLGAGVAGFAAIRYLNDLLESGDDQDRVNNSRT